MPEYASFEEEMAADAKKNKIWNETKALIKKNEALLPTPGPVVPPEKPVKKDKFKIKAQVFGWSDVE